MEGRCSAVQSDGCPGSVGRGHDAEAKPEVACSDELLVEWEPHPDNTEL